MQSTSTELDRIRQYCVEIAQQLHRIVALSDRVVEPVLVALLSHGHVLIEGVPGTGKTILARTLARCLDASFRRIQFTNDLMPSDIVGSTIWKKDTERFVFVPGPIFANVVLTDEINRTSPRTLSCLLEAMEEGHVSVEGKPTPLPDPFLVLATRNPVEFHGTFPIPEAALDRFLVRVELEYPTAEQETALYRGHDANRLLADLEPIIGIDALRSFQHAVDQVTVSGPIATFCHHVVTATREHPATALGASPRAGLAWLRAARARALMEGRDYVIPDDLQALAVPVLAHRIFLQGGGTSRGLIEEILDTHPVPL